MKITNDKITFDAADFDALSDFAKKALPPYSGSTPFLETFSNQLNEHIRIAKTLLKQQSAADPKVEAVVAGLAIADDQKRQDAQVCLDQLIVILGVPAVAEDEIAAAEVKV